MSAGMIKFTPGPWHAGAEARIVYDAAGWAIANAITFHGKHGAHDAYGNGRLIAAAPDLLAMLVDAHDIIDAIGQPETAEVAGRMRAVIAKAKGEA